MKGTCIYCHKEKDVIPYMCCLGMCKECIGRLIDEKVLSKSKKVKRTG
jgi:hypothetical protein